MYTSPTPPCITGDSTAVCQCVHQSYSTLYTRGHNGSVSMCTPVLLHPVYQGTAGLCVNVYTSPTPPCITGDSTAVCQCVHQSYSTLYTRGHNGSVSMCTPVLLHPVYQGTAGLHVNEHIKHSSTQFRQNSVTLSITPATRVAYIVEGGSTVVEVCKVGLLR